MCVCDVCAPVTPRSVSGRVRVFVVAVPGRGEVVFSCMRWFSHVRVSFSQSIFPGDGALVMQYLCQSVPQPLEVPGYFSHHLWHFSSSVVAEEGGRAYDGGTLYKGPIPLVVWYVQF